ncbi:MAG: hypothetical protein FJ257_09255 [Phycisphaerae bacterium]|nr:hypothetical protein [Phycisphaerae bacterium]
MIYRIVRAVRESYAFVVMALFGLLFLAALGCVFLLPVGSVVILLGSILLLVVVWVLGEVLAVIERSLARPSLRRSLCPCCRGEVVRTEVAPRRTTLPGLDTAIDPWPTAVLQCTRCPAVFLETGEVFREDPDFRPAPAST